LWEKGAKQREGIFQNWSGRKEKESMQAVDEVVILLSQALFFLFGWFFFRRKLFKDYEVKNIVVQVLFASIFTLSCTMFELIIFEIVNFLDKRLGWVVYRSDRSVFCLLIQ